MKEDSSYIIFLHSLCPTAKPSQFWMAECSRCCWIPSRLKSPISREQSAETMQISPRARGDFDGLISFLWGGHRTQEGVLSLTCSKCYSWHTNAGVQRHPHIHAQRGAEAHMPTHTHFLIQAFSPSLRHLQAKKSRPEQMKTETPDTFDG